MINLDRSAPYFVMFKLFPGSGSADHDYDDFQRRKRILTPVSTSEQPNTPSTAVVSPIPNSLPSDYSQLLAQRRFRDVNPRSETIVEYPVLGDGNFTLKVISEHTQRTIISLEKVSFVFGCYESTSEGNVWQTISEETIYGNIDSELPQSRVIEADVDTISDKKEMFGSCFSLDCIRRSYYLRIVVKNSVKTSFSVEVWQKDADPESKETPFKQLFGSTSLKYRFLGLSEDEFFEESKSYEPKKYLDSKFDIQLEQGFYVFIAKVVNETDDIIDEEPFSIWCNVELVRSLLYFL